MFRKAGRETSFEQVKAIHSSPSPSCRRTNSITMHLHQMLNHLVLAWEILAPSHLTLVASIDWAPKAWVASVAHLMLGSVVPAQLVVSTEGCAVAGRDVADVFARPSHSVCATRNVLVVVDPSRRGSGREVRRISIDDQVARLAEIDLLVSGGGKVVGVRLPGSIGVERTWPRSGSASF